VSEVLEITLRRFIQSTDSRFDKTDQQIQVLTELVAQLGEYVYTVTDMLESQSFTELEWPMDENQLELAFPSN
jgi:hypothetical protein